jgi:hypothetical protein
MDPLEKCLSLWAQGQGWPTGPWKFPAGEIAAFEPLEPDFDVGPRVCIVAECAREFLMDLSALHPLIQTYLITNLCSSVSIHRR